MVIYADVLIILNLAVNYFILLATCRLCKTELTFLRLLAGAGLGALFSLYILFPSPNAFLGTLFRLTFGAAIVFAAFGRRKPRIFLRLWAVFMAATFLFGGIMLAVYTIFKPSGMAIDGGVVYFDISPLLLVSSTAVCYCIIRLIQRLAERKAPGAKRISVTLVLGNNKINVMAMVDTGHSLTDPFTGSPVILLSEKRAKELLNGPLQLAKDIGCYRLVPCRTANGEGLLEGIRLDNVIIGQQSLNQKTVAAVSETIGQDDYDAVISPLMLP